MIQKFSTWRRDKLGKCFIKYAAPIDLNEYIASHKASGGNGDLASKLSQDLYRIHQQEQVITMNSLISTSIFYHNDSSVTFK